MDFEKAIIYGNVNVLKDMVDRGELIVVRRHVKFAKEMKRKCSTPETEQNYIDTINFLKSECKCKVFL